MNTKRFVYVIKNDLNKLVYVGQTQDPSYRWKQHLSNSARLNSKLYVTMRELGTDSFYHEVVAEASSDDESTAMEQALIAELERSDWTLLNSNYAGKPSAGKKHKDLVEDFLMRLVLDTHVGGLLPTIVELTELTDACKSSVQRAYNVMKQLGIVKVDRRSRRYVRAA